DCEGELSARAQDSFPTTSIDRLIAIRFLSSSQTLPRSIGTLVRAFPDQPPKSRIVERSINRPSPFPVRRYQSSRETAETLRLVFGGVSYSQRSNAQNDQVQTRLQTTP